MNDYIRSALLELNTRYPGYSFDIDEFGSHYVLLWCRYRYNEFDTILIKTRIVDLSYEIIVKEGKRLMHEIELKRDARWAGNTYLDIRTMSINKYSIVPKEVIFQDEKATIINWTDSTKTIVKCSDDDVFSPEAGVALCYMKKFITDNDSERFHRILKSLVSVSKFKKSKQEDKSSGISNILAVGVSSTIKKAINIIYGLEGNHDIDTRTSDNSGDNDPDGSAVEVES